MVADALSTAVFVLGCEAGVAFAEAQGVDALMVDQAGRIFTTAGMKEYLYVCCDAFSAHGHTDNEARP